METPVVPTLVQPITRLLCAAALLLPALPAGAAVYAVGPGPGCTHTTIQAAINAAEANPGDDFIRIPHSQVWNGQALVINTNQALWLEGFWSDCNTIDGSLRATIDGAGGSAAPVLRIEAGTGSFVSLDSLTIRNGDVAGGNKGGGIYYRGNGSLAIANSAIINSTAGYGGGMYLEGTGVDAVVVIHGGVGITGNTARYSGGGVFAEAVRLYMTAPNSLIAFNEAQGVSLGGTTIGGYGGGLVVNSTDALDGFATIGSAGVGNAGAIHGNAALFGGGVAVLGEANADNKDAILNLHATQAGAPAKISQNFAERSGGGLYVRGVRSGGDISEAITNLWHASIEGNAAADGAAIAVDEWGSLYVNARRASALPPEGAPPCPVGEPCSRIVGNIDQDALGEPTGGAVISLRGGSSHIGLGIDAIPDLPGARGVSIEGNRGGRLIDLDGQFVDLAGAGVVIAGNEVGERLIRATGESVLRLFSSTIAGNMISGPAVMDLDGDGSRLEGIVLWQPGKVSRTGNAMPTVLWTIASEAGSLGGGPGAVVADPRFIDPARGDYRLRAASPAIDWAPPVVGDDRDVYAMPRDQRMGIVPRLDPSRHRDAGGFERQNLLPLVLNGEFAGDTNLWALPVGHAGAYQATNAPGSTAGTGAAQVVGTSTTGRLLGYAQCVHLPGPGLYTLNGTGRSDANPQLSNPTALIWELRANGGEGCGDGPITAGGTHILGTQQTTDLWIRPVAPATIAVPAGLWNTNTSLTVVMAVYPNASNSTAYTGQFDAIRLEPAGDLIFANDFEL
jgi:hypothetical protein